ncbi:MAG: DUF308 domain-containing protein [Flavobacteriaceae bacterium]|nr:DUF308 domain-containing protein [Flavobacteriaceae bacterium]
MSNLISKVSGTVKNWWVLLIIGILLIIGAVWMFKAPAESFLSLVTFLSTLILISGILTVFFAFANKDKIDNWGVFLAGGILDILIGFIFLKFPGVTIVLFAMFVGFWLLFKGANIISSSFDLKREGESNWWWVLIMGILTVVFAVMAIANPILGVGYVVYTLAFAFLLLGIANIFLSFQLKKVKSRVGDFKENIAAKVENLKE